QSEIQTQPNGKDVSVVFLPALPVGADGERRQCLGGRLVDTVEPAECPDVRHLDGGPARSVPPEFARPDQVGLFKITLGVAGRLAQPTQPPAELAPDNGWSLKRHNHASDRLTVKQDG